MRRKKLLLNLQMQISSKKLRLWSNNRKRIKSRRNTWTSQISWSLSDATSEAVEILELLRFLRFLRCFLIWLLHHSPLFHLCDKDSFRDNYLITRLGLQIEKKNLHHQKQIEFELTSISWRFLRARAPHTNQRRPTTTQAMLKIWQSFLLGLKQ